MMIRVLLVDDNPSFLATASAYLDADPEIAVIGQAKSASQGFDLYQALGAEVVVLDYAMPLMKGDEACIQFKTLSDPPKVIMLTIHDIAEYRTRSLQSGADDFIPKSELVTRLIPSIKLLVHPG